VIALIRQHIITSLVFKFWTSSVTSPCDSPDQAAQYHILVFKFWLSSLNQHLIGYGLGKLHFMLMPVGLSSLQTEWMDFDQICHCKSSLKHVGYFNLCLNWITVAHYHYLYMFAHLLSHLCALESTLYTFPHLISLFRLVIFKGSQMYLGSLGTVEKKQEKI
jgi:hypothetical protein